MRIIVLGSGTSHGVPSIGCDCAVCRSSDPRDRRTGLRCGGNRRKRVCFNGDTLDTGVCRMAFFSDPDGNDLMLHHRYAPYSPTP